MYELLHVSGEVLKHLNPNTTSVEDEGARFCVKYSEEEKSSIVKNLYRDYMCGELLFI